MRLISGPLERFLSVFASVRRGEGLTASLLMVNVFILMTAYYIIKPVREALILAGAGAEIKSYAGAVQAMLFLLIVPMYSAFAGRVNRIRLINGDCILHIEPCVVLSPRAFQLSYRYRVLPVGWTLQCDADCPVLGLCE